MNDIIEEKQYRDNILQNYELTDLVKLEKLQKIQDAFAEANQVASTIVDTTGIPITSPSNHTIICQRIRASEKGMEKCRLSGQQLGLAAAKKKTAYYQKCLSLGFSDAAAPIFIEGRHIANWLVGQYHIQDVDEQRIREYSREIGVDEEEMAQEFRRMPKIPTERFEKILEFLFIMANEISLMGYNNLVTLRQSEELRETKLQLEENQILLQRKVEERTRDLSVANSSLTEEIRKTKAIQQDQEKLLTAFRHVAEGIVITDTSGKILYINPAVEKLTGYTADELLGDNPRILKSDKHDKDFYRQFWQKIAGGEVWAGRFINRRKDGNLYHEESTVSCVKDSKGKVANYVAVKRDITKDIEMEKQLQQMSKLEAIGTLAAGVAHEINTPVQYVTDNTRFISEAMEDFLHLQTLQKDLEDLNEAEDLFQEQRKKISEFKEEMDLEFLETETAKAVSASLEGLERISTIVKAMKDFSHPGSQERSAANLNDIIRNTVDVSRNEWKYNAEIELALDNSLPSVPVLTSQLKQVLLNIIVNSSQAIAENIKNGTMEKGVIHIATYHNENEAIVKIADNGCGIPDEVMDKIFDPFFTTKTVGKGTGQGLSLAYNIVVDGHDGSISATSEAGAGAEFTIKLPLQMRSAASGDE